MIYQEIFKLTETCKITESKPNSITIEIDAANNKKLLDDINKKYFIKKIGQRKVEKKWSRLHFEVSIYYINDLL